MGIIRRSRACALASLTTVLICLGGRVAAEEDENGGFTLSRAEGYVGCWYSNSTTKDEYRYKYSGGMATYPQQHLAPLPFTI